METHPVLICKRAPLTLTHMHHSHKQAWKNPIKQASVTQTCTNSFNLYSGVDLKVLNTRLFGILESAWSVVHSAVKCLWIMTVKMCIILSKGLSYHSRFSFFSHNNFNSKQYYVFIYSSCVWDTEKLNPYHSDATDNDWLNYILSVDLDL